MSIARRLARDGLTVTLCERSTCGREASWAGAGILSPCNPHRNDPIFHFQERSLSLYPQFCMELRAETGIDMEYERCGELQLLFTEDAVNIARSDERAAVGRVIEPGVPLYQWRSRNETCKIEPAVSTEVLGSLECRQTAQLRNPRLLQALRQACLRAGVNLREHAAVDELIIDGSRVTGVRVGDERLEAGCVVVCAGAWSSAIGKRLANLMPVHPLRGQIVLLQLAHRPFQRIISHGRFYLVPRRDGHVLLGSTEEPHAGFEKRNTAKGISLLMEKALRMVPSLADAPVQAIWSGLRPGTPDDKPYLGPVPDHDGLIAATGHFRTGLTLAPATADAVAAAVQNRPYDIDLNSCRPGRA